jgi:hypothetical protein
MPSTGDRQVSRPLTVVLCAEILRKHKTWSSKVQKSQFCSHIGTSVADSDPDCVRIELNQWIRIREGKILKIET